VTIDHVVDGDLPVPAIEAQPACVQSDLELEVRRFHPVDFSDASRAAIRFRGRFVAQTTDPSCKLAGSHSKSMLRRFHRRSAGTRE